MLTKTERKVLYKMSGGEEYYQKELHPDYNFLERMVKKGLLKKRWGPWSGETLYSKV